MGAVVRTPNLRERVTFQRLTGGDDGYGNVVAGWADLSGGVSIPADMRETPGKERVDAGRLEASATATIRIRSSAFARGLTETDRVLARGVAWNIRGIAPMGNNGMFLDILCERGVAT
jgi:SPP1 family predicted phage head-tail adaptor